MCFFNVFLYEWALFVIIKRRSYLLQTILSLILHQIFLTKVFLMLFHVYLIHFYQEKWKKRREMYKMSYLEKKRRGQENNYLPFVMWFLALLEVWKKRIGFLILPYFKTIQVPSGLPWIYLEMLQTILSFKSTMLFTVSFISLHNSRI